MIRTSRRAFTRNPRVDIRIRILIRIASSRCRKGSRAEIFPHTVLRGTNLHVHATSAPRAFTAPRSKQGVLQERTPQTHPRRQESIWTPEIDPSGEKTGNLISETLNGTAIFAEHTTTTTPAKTARLSPFQGFQAPPSLCFVGPPTLVWHDAGLLHAFERK